MALWDDAIAPFTGQGYQQDNSSLWGLLSSLVQGGSFPSSFSSLGANAQALPPSTQLPPDLGRWQPSTGPGDYAQRRAQALEEGQGELEESQRSLPGYAEGQKIPGAAQQRQGEAFGDEPTPGVIPGRDEPLWRQLYRQQEIERMYRQLQLGREQSI